MFRPFETELAIKVRTYDIDYGGVVSNIVYIRWLEDLRVTMLSGMFPFEKQLYNRLAPVLMKTNIEYKGTIRLLDQPIGRMWIKSMTPMKWTVSAEFSVNGSVTTVAEQMGAFVNLEKGRPVRIPKELLNAYQEYSSDAS